MEPGEEKEKEQGNNTQDQEEMDVTEKVSTQLELPDVSQNGEGKE